MLFNSLRSLFSELKIIIIPKTLIHNNSKNINSSLSSAEGKCYSEGWDVDQVPDGMVGVTSSYDRHLMAFPLSIISFFIL